MFVNLRHAKLVYKNWNGRYGDPMLLDYFFNKAIHQWWHDAPSYSYYFVAYLAVGMCFASAMRHIMFNPDVGFKRSEQKRNIVDRWQRHMYSLPFFNHSLRTYCSKFTNSLVDNEPDWMRSHEWKIRPDRNLHYARFPLILSIQKYFTDDELYERASHQEREKYYKSIGYYGTSETEGGDETED